MSAKKLNMVVTKKSMKLYCLDLGETLIVPAGTELVRFPGKKGKSVYVHVKGTDYFEIEPGAKYFLVKDKFSLTMKYKKVGGK